MTVTISHTAAVERHFSHICQTRDPSIVATSQPSNPHQLDPIKLQRDNMSINRSAGYWSFSECKYERKGMKKCIFVCVYVSWGSLTCKTLFRKLLNKSSIRRLNTNSCLCSRSVCADTHVLMCTRTCVNTLDPKHWCSYFCDSLLCCAQTRRFSLLSFSQTTADYHRGTKASGPLNWGLARLLEVGSAHFSEERKSPLDHRSGLDESVAFSHSLNTVASDITG